MADETEGYVPADAPPPDDVSQAFQGDSAAVQVDPSHPDQPKPDDPVPPAPAIPENA